MSPLGGQAVLRILGTAEILRSVPTNVTYFNTDPTSDLFFELTNLSVGQNMTESINAAIGSLYINLLFTPENNEFMDMWGNPKIPLFSSHLNSTSEDWIYSSISELEYSSLVGIPLFSELPIGTTSFSLESSYMEAVCENITYQPTIAFEPFSAYYLPEGLNWTYYPIMVRSEVQIILETGVSASIPFFLHYKMSLDIMSGNFLSPCYLENLTYSQASPGTLLLQIYDFNASSAVNSTVIPCQMHQVYVESNVSCSRGLSSTANCSVYSQRLSQKPHAPSAITLLSFAELFAKLAMAMPEAYPNYISENPDPSMLYLENTSSSYVSSGGGFYGFQASEISLESFHLDSHRSLIPTFRSVRSSLFSDKTYP
jgi:hypothetical protein